MSALDGYCKILRLKLSQFRLNTSYDSERMLVFGQETLNEDGQYYDKQEKQEPTKKGVG